METQKINYIESQVEMFIERSQTDLELGKITQAQLDKEAEKYRKQLYKEAEKEN